MLLGAAPAWAVVESQTFDDAASTTAAGWAGYVPAGVTGVDLDFRNTNNAGGVPGEAGGWIPSRTTDIAYYADITLADNPTQADVITASGRLVVPTINAGFDGGFEFGFFDSTNLVPVGIGGGGGPYDFVGFRFLESDATHLRWWPRMVGAAGAATTRLDAAVQYLFDLTYDPNGAGPGLGRLTADLRRADNNESLGAITVSYGSTGAPLNLNAFGLLTLDFNANTPSAEIYLDNLQYGNEAAVPVVPLIEHQSFESAASAAAAGWTGRLNTLADGLGVDVGYRDSALAGGTPGEAGGAMPSRTANDFAYFADTTLGVSLGEEDVLLATGRFTADSLAAGFDGGFELGFFNADDLTRIPSPAMGVGGVEDAIAIRFIDSSASQLRFAARADRMEAQSSARLDVGVDYLFDLAYDPNGSGEDLGTLTVEFRRASDSVIVGSATLTGIPSGGGEMDLNAFGLVSLNFSSIQPAANVYIDDLSYTAVPEPSALWLLAMGGMILGGRWWRKR
jgi:hypothetical protein